MSSHFNDLRTAQKGKQMNFVMKAHNSLDADSGLVHTLGCTSGVVHDLMEKNRLLHGEDNSVVGDVVGIIQLRDSAQQMGGDDAMSAPKVRAKAAQTSRRIPHGFGSMRVKLRDLKNKHKLSYPTASYSSHP